MKDRYITSISWHRTEDLLPEVSGSYLALTKTGRVAELDYSTVHKAFNCTDNDSAECVDVFHIDVKAWAHVDAITTLFDKENDNEKNS